MSHPFIENAYGLWCPVCEERIDEFWPECCDACGYPDPRAVADFEADRDRDWDLW